MLEDTTKVKDGSIKCHRKLRVHLSRLKTPLNDNVKSSKSVSNQSCRVHSPIVKIRKSKCDEIPSCETLSVTTSQSITDDEEHMSTCPTTNSEEYPTLSLTKIPTLYYQGECKPIGAGTLCTEHVQCFSDSGVSVDDSDAKCDHPPKLVRQVCSSHEQSATEADDHCFNWQRCDQQWRSDCMTVRTKQSLDCIGSRKICFADRQSKMRNRRRQKQKKKLSYKQAAYILHKRKRQNHERKVLRTKNLGSTKHDRSAADFQVSLQGKLGKQNPKRTLQVTLKHVKTRKMRLNIPSLKAKEDKTKEKHIREDFEDISPLPKLNVPDRCPGWKEQQRKASMINDDTSSAKSVGINQEISGDQALMKDIEQTGHEISNSMGYLQYSGEKRGKNSIGIIGDRSKMLRDEHQQMPTTADEPSDSPGFRSSVNGTKKKTNDQLPLYHLNQIEKLKAELKRINRKSLDEKSALTRTFPREKNGTDYRHKKLSLILRPSSSTPSSHPCQRSPVKGSTGDHHVQQETEMGTADLQRTPIRSKMDTYGDLVDEDYGGGDDEDDEDDDVIIESITTPKSLKREQITSCMSDILDTRRSSSKAPTPTLKDVCERLISDFGQKIRPWKRYIEEQYGILTSNESAPPSLPVEQDRVLVTVGRYAISQSDISSLQEDAWVNDNIINAYFHLIAETSPFEVLPLSSFFYQVYSKNGFSQVQRWHRKTDIFSKQLILIPIHSRHHWCLVVVDTGVSSITFYDSMRHGGKTYTTKVQSMQRDWVWGSMLSSLTQRQQDFDER
ncbi:hypothetical protein BSL78_16600 [Apostichopus japonicus]|uniref:Ubiquitin-like protease family profile domain-containing protein n=1 Tax=Stichopus japonicus TaxID=307972 RepID=A0A2G8KEV7_STIJA|nr:hypothetical protein BSL78_16600 [Apostichopus japonicus]